MAVRHGYGKIAGADALVFAYDTGDTRNSYKGEPTENFANTDTARTLVKHDASSVMTFADAPEKGPGWKKVTITERSAINFRYAQFPYISNPGGTQRTYSVEYDAGSLTGYGWRVDGTAGYNTTNFTGTGRYQITITPGVTGVYALFLTNSSSATGINDTIYYRFYQVENNSHATPFVNGTRSATEGLKDLTGNSSIDLSNVSFDSNAQMTFDGTNDTISVPSYSAIELVDNVSIEYVYKRLSTDPILDVIANKYHSTGWELFCTNANKFSLAGRNGDGTYYSTTNGAYTIQNNQYYHLVAMKEGLSWRLYVNGELYASLTANTVGTWSNTGILQIGGEGNGYYPDMQLPILKIYNRILTADEVRNNYRHYKKRFNI